MPFDKLLASLAPLIERCLAPAQSDPALREQLHRFAEALLELTAPTSGLDAPREPPVAPSDAAAQSGSWPLPAPRVEAGEFGSQLEKAEPVSELLPRLTLGQRTPGPAVSYPERFSTPEGHDLAQLETRLRMKAEGARWAARRRELLRSDAPFDTEIEPMDRDIIVRAKAIPDCFLWMNHPSSPSPEDLSLYEDLARCFECVADMLVILRTIQSAANAVRTEFELALDLLAEAQSALRTAVERLGAATDTDQIKVYNWLRVTAAENQFYIRRHFRAEDPADPKQWPDLVARIDALDRRLHKSHDRDKVRKKLLGKLRHKVQQVADNTPDAEEQWRAVVAIVDELVNDGLPPSNCELRDLLAPVIDDAPPLADPPKGFQLVAREIDRYLSTTLPVTATKAARLSPEVEQVAKWLHGRSLALVGGDRRPKAAEALKAAFGLRELVWIASREHESLEGFKPLVAQPDVAIVVLAIRWSSHSHGGIKSFCDDLGKPMVRLPRGYNPNQVAHEICQQVGQILAAEHAT